MLLSDGNHCGATPVHWFQCWKSNMLEITSATNSLALNIDAHITLSLWSVYYSLLSRLTWAESFLFIIQYLPDIHGSQAYALRNWWRGRRGVFRLNVGCAITQMICCIFCPTWQGYWIRNDCRGWESRLRMHPNTHTHTLLTHIRDSTIGLSSHSQAKYSSPVSVHTIISYLLVFCIIL